MYRMKSFTSYFSWHSMRSAISNINSKSRIKRSLPVKHLCHGKLAMLPGELACAACETAGMQGPGPAANIR